MTATLDSAILPAPPAGTPYGGRYIVLRFRLRVSARVESLIRIAIRREHREWRNILGAARARQRELLRCIEMREGRSGKQLSVNRERLKQIVRSIISPIPTLHSSGTGSMIVEMEATLAGWLELYIEWIGRGRPPAEKPAFPTAGISSEERAWLAWATTLDQAPSLAADLAIETRWRAAVTRVPRARRHPFSFGAMMSGIPTDTYGGLMWRPGDRKLFAALTLLPQNDRRGRQTQVARNRRHTGPVYNVRAGEKGMIARAGRGRCAVLCPLEFGRGHLKLLRRCRPKSGRVVERPDGLWLDVALDLPKMQRLEGDHILAIQRGFETLLSAAIVAPDGSLVAEQRIDGRDLMRAISAIRINRATRQQKGRLTRGDRRAARITAHHVASAVQQVLDFARQYPIGYIVILADRRMRQPTPMLAWRHWAALRDRLVQRAIAIHAGVEYPTPREWQLHGSRRLCPACGWDPRTWKAAALEAAGGDQHRCLACNRVRLPEIDGAWLAGEDFLRAMAYRQKEKGTRPPLASFIRSLHEQRAHLDN